MESFYGNYFIKFATTTAMRPTMAMNSTPITKLDALGKPNASTSTPDTLGPRKTPRAYDAFQN